MTPTNTRFSGQIAVVTGGASGIGSAVARRLASHGAIVAMFDRDEAQLQATRDALSDEGLSVGATRVDITSEESVVAGIDAVLAEHGRLDIMVNCAGVVGPTNTKILEYDSAQFDQVCNVNLRGSFLMTKHAIKPMVQQDYGRILLYASIAGKEGNPGMCGYSTSKSAVLGLVKAIGKEYAETGVTVNGIAPAVIRTPMVEAADPAMVTYMTDRIPMKRTGSLDEAADMTAFIVSRECSFCTGAIFDLSGGRATY
ncbi:MAG: SDR family NAD(P)-dependent oxidoreductase [Verrucomicrobia bacterium]|nr:SDR family NAD(P)-dependent oxidoreductase [Verrucomicrobiota bacterium]MDA1085944.1 SDR family NAD(P)-dependent oxidoreductase [Verrucomicrobiota bacterium]